MVDYKMVIVLRKDLHLPIGKGISQCCHACLAAYEIAKANRPDIVRNWERYGSAKIVLRALSEKELLLIYKDAKHHNLPTSLICDAGRTVLEPGTPTAVGIGPSNVEKIDLITKSLKLY